VSQTPRSAKVYYGSHASSVIGRPLLPTGVMPPRGLGQRPMSEHSRTATKYYADRTDYGGKAAAPAVSGALRALTEADVPGVTAGVFDALGFGTDKVQVVCGSDALVRMLRTRLEMGVARGELDADRCRDVVFAVSPSTLAPPPPPVVEAPAVEPAALEDEDEDAQFYAQMAAEEAQASGR